MNRKTRLVELVEEMSKDEFNEFLRQAAEELQKKNK